MRRKEAEETEIINADRPRKELHEITKSGTVWWELFEDLNSVGGCERISGRRKIGDYKS